MLCFVASDARFWFCFEFARSEFLDEQGGCLRKEIASSFLNFPWANLAEVTRYNADWSNLCVVTADAICEIYLVLEYAFHIGAIVIELGNLKPSESTDVLAKVKELTQLISVAPAFKK